MTCTSLLVAITFVLFAHDAAAQSSYSDVLNTYRDSLQHSGVVLMVDDGNGDPFVGTIGEAYADKPLAADVRFGIGSVSKMYTAATVMRLHEKGALHVDSLYSTYVRDLRFEKDTVFGVTVRDLLQHTSGIDELFGVKTLNRSIAEPFADYPDTMFTNHVSVTELKEKRYNYSTSNYFLLRILVERVTDKPFEEVVREEIIEPLGLTNTFLYSSRSIDNLAHPMLGERDFSNMPKRGMNAISRGGGNFVSTAADLNSFIRALLLDKRVVHDSTLQRMTSFVAGKSSKVGLGVFEDTYGDRTLWGHTGRTFSYIAYAYVDPTTGASFIALGNDANSDIIDKVFEGLAKAHLLRSE